MKREEGFGAMERTNEKALFETPAIKWLLHIIYGLVALSCALGIWYIFKPGAMKIFVPIVGTVCFGVFTLLGWWFTNKENGKYKLNYCVLCMSLISAHSLQVYLNTTGLLIVQKSIVWLFLFGFCVFSFKYALRQSYVHRIRLTSVLMGIIFASFAFIGLQIKNFERIEMLYAMPPDMFTSMLIIFVGQICFFTIELNAVFSYFINMDFSNGENPVFSRRKGVIYFSILTLGIVLCWLPYYAIFYPGVISADSLSEIRQQLGMATLSNHHPFMHQMLIGLSLRLGGSSLELGVGIYSAIQMFLLAAAFAICVFYLGRMGAGKFICIFVFCFFAFFPVNALYSITMWKDVLFGAISLCLTMLLINEVKNEDRGNRRLWLGIALVLTAFFFCVFRNNGWYAFLLGFPLYIICNRKNWKRLCAIFLAVVILVSAYNHVIFDVMGIKKSSSGEALSIPLQQIARVVKNEPEVVDSPDFQVLKEIFTDAKKLGEIYFPIVSDPVKAPDMFLAKVFDENPIRYMKAWAKLGLNYPIAYLEAFLVQNYGYWYPDVPYWVAISFIQENDLGLEQRPENKAIRENIKSRLDDQVVNRPISVIYSLALMVWLMMMAAAILILKGQGRIASPIFILAGIWLTTLASPVYCEYRYMYGFVVCVPLFLGLALGMKNIRQQD